jgi:hypothetical protein
MKLSQFTPSVNKNTMNAKIQAVDHPNAYGANQAGANALNATLSAGIGAYQKVWLKDQNDKIFDAKNDYEQRINSLMDDENTGLFNTHQGKAAENLQKDYTDQEQKIYQQVLQDHGISSDYAVRAFGEQRAQSQTSNLRMIDKYQRKQMEDYAGNQISLMTSNMVNQSVKDPDSLITNFGSWEKNTTAILAGLSMDSAAIDVKMKALKNDKAKEIMQSYLTTGDYSAGLNAIAYMKSQGIDEPILKAYKDQFLQKKMTREIKSSAEDYVKGNGLNLTNMTWEQFRDSWHKDHPTPVPQGKGSVTGNQIAEFARNNYTEGDQWMGSVTKDPTIQCDSWTADVYAKTGLFPDGTITHGSDFGDAYHEAGDGYEPQPGDFIDGEKHVGIYLGNGQYMARNSSGGIHIGSMDEWNEWFGNPIGYGSVAEARGEAPDDMSDEERAELQDKSDAALKQQYAEIRSNQVSYIQSQVQNITKGILEMEQNGSTPGQVYEYAADIVNNDPLLKDSSAGVTLLGRLMNQKRTYEKSQNRAANVGRGLDTSGCLKEKQFNALEGFIGTKINSIEDLDNTIKDLQEEGVYLTAEQDAKIRKDVIDCANGVGTFAVKIPDDDATIAAMCYTNTSAVTSTAKMLIKREIMDFKNEQGRDPDNEELRTIYYDVIGKEGLDSTGKTKIGGINIFGVNLFGDDYEAPTMSKAQAYNDHIRETSQAVDEDGNPNGFYIDVDYGNGKSETKWVSDEQMRQISNGELSVFDI